MNRNVKTLAMLGVCLVGAPIWMGLGCPPTQLPTGTPQLFVANLDNSVLSFLNPKTLNGNVAPSTNLSGQQTFLNNPADIAITASGVLLAANLSPGNGAITGYPGAVSANGDVVAARNVQGASTGLGDPVTIAVSTANDLAFVANVDAPFDINVYAGASTTAFNGNLPPTRTIKSTALNIPLGICFGANDDLYVANNGDSKILVFANASNRNGPITPDRTITNSSFADVFDVYVDSGDRLYVLNGQKGGNKVLVINTASTKNGGVGLDSILTVTGAVALTALVVDKNQTGYIMDRDTNSILSYDTINTRSGSFAPDRSISGVATKLSRPVGCFLVE